MSEDFMDKYNDLNQDNELNQESEVKENDPFTEQTQSQPQQSADDAAADGYADVRQEEPARQSDYTPYVQQSAPSPSYGETSYSAQKTEDQSIEDATPADRVFTNPYTGSNVYEQQSYTHPSQSPSGYYHQSYVNAQPRQTASQYTDPYSRTTAQNPSASANPYARPSYQPQRAQRQPKAKIGAGTVALILVVCIIVSGFAGFGGSMLAGYLRSGSTKAAGDTMIIHQVEATDVSVDSDKLVDKSTEQITEEVADSVVEITTEVMQTSTFYGQYIATGAGSGVIISDDGYILTNNHVIDGASSVSVTLRSGDSYSATVVGADDVVDIALLKIEATGLTPAVFGNSDELKVGDKTVVIGNPLGTLGGSVTEGIVSALDRAIVIDGQSMHLMQTDAAINPGNSGGGTFNGQGELVGIVVAKSSNSSSGATIDNIGFVIPINNVLSILSDLKDYGYVRGRGDTGMTFVDLSNAMYSMYYYNNQNPGVYIYSVNRGSNAASAGFQPGDRVISVNGTEVSSSSEVESIISSLSAGDTVEFELERGGQTGKLTLTLEERIPDNSSTASSGGNGYNPFGY